MKYIRTKDGIFEVVKEDDEWVDIISNFERKTKCQCCIKKKGIIKQADTIEELCDEFVVEDRDEFAIFHNLKLAKQTKGIIYGAIWTDKGLIYVAKMNEKGELELI